MYVDESGDSGKEKTPTRLEKFVGRQFLCEPHLHLYVEDAGLDWAFPLEEVWNGMAKFDRGGELEFAIEWFARYLNIETKLEFEYRLDL